MSYEVFHAYFPEIAERETREIYINVDSGTLKGAYGLVEMYCADAGCDCRRVMLNVLSEREKAVVAVICFGWESRKFYEKWFGSDEKDWIDELKGPCLNSGSNQSKYASELLEVVKDLVLTDRNYVERLKRHYRMFREKIDGKSLNKDNVIKLLEYKTGRNDPCTCGSGKKSKKCCGK